MVRLSTNASGQCYPRSLTTQNATVVLGNYIQQADHILAGMFTRNPDVTGITFPAPHGRAAHTATPDDPHVLPHDRALTAIMDARQRGEITADEMIAQIRQAGS
ncbi:hypothetical protein HUK81_18315 [Komagataeibacter swingsii]|uniref:Uncharacterized protein n=1 Tax=Komagataeibacter swingsii TaxID=215220 RepID=A0A850PCP6_9PROT|nr:hypothetical protein [Komagataeibacter swingsii]